MSNTIINSYAHVIPVPIPPTISDLYVWYDASDASSITKTGSNEVTQWNNKEGTTARDLLQASTGDSPTLVSANQNGLNTLNFTGNSFMLSATTLAVETAPITAFFACKIPAAAGLTQHIMSNKVASGGGANVYHPLYTETDNSIRFSNTSGGTVQLNSASLMGSFVYCTSVSDGTSGFMRLNGSLQATTPSSPLGSANSFEGMCVGRYNDVSDKYWNELIGEIIIYNKLLDATEIATIESYLSDKWIP